MKETGKKQGGLRMKRKIRKITYYFINIVFGILFTFVNIFVFRYVFEAPHEVKITNVLLDMILSIVTAVDLGIIGFFLAIFMWFILLLIFLTYKWFKEFDNDINFIDYIKNELK